MKYKKNIFFAVISFILAVVFLYFTFIEQNKLSSVQSEYLNKMSEVFSLDSESLANRLLSELSEYRNDDVKFQTFEEKIKYLIKHNGDFLLLISAPIQQVLIIFKALLILCGVVFVVSITFLYFRK